MNHHLARVAGALALILVLATSCGDGKDPATGFNLEKCTETGLCECTSNLECPGARICVNGWCEAGAGVGGDITGEDGAVGADVAFDVPLDPGAFGAPCGSDDDCDSNVCMEVAPGVSVCTRTCISECPPGWDCRGISEGDTLVFYCPPSSTGSASPVSPMRAVPAQRTSASTWAGSSPAVGAVRRGSAPTGTPARTG